MQILRALKDKHKYKCYLVSSYNPTHFIRKSVHDVAALTLSAKDRGVCDCEADVTWEPRRQAKKHVMIAEMWFFSEMQRIQWENCKASAIRP